MAMNDEELRDIDIVRDRVNRERPSGFGLGVNTMTKPMPVDMPSPSSRGVGAPMSMIGRPGTGEGPDRSRNTTFEGGGSFNVVKMVKPKATPAAGVGASAPAAKDDVYTQAIQQLQAISDAPKRREWVTSQGTKVTSRIDRSDEIAASKAIIDAENLRRGFGVKADISAGELEVKKEGIHQRGRGLIQKTISEDKDRDIKSQRAFTEQLRLNSPKSITGTSDTTVGLFRMALSGAPVHASYQASAKRLLEGFNSLYPRFLKENGLEDTPENKKMALQMYESTISVPEE